MSAHPAPHWTPDSIAELKRLWAEGRTLSQIAVALKLPSRGAVSGKIYRMRKGGDPLPRSAVVIRMNVMEGNRDRPKKPKPNFTIGPPSLAREPRAVARVLAFVPSNPRPFIELPRCGRCKWPMGDAPRGEADTMLMCAEVVAEGCVYCAFHYGVGHVPVPASKRRRA